VWRVSPLSYHVPEHYNTAIVHGDLQKTCDKLQDPSPSVLCCIADLCRRSVYVELP
jgi:hypothetical protein